MSKISRYAKAVAALLGTFQAWGLAVTHADSAGGASIVGGEWFGLCGVGIAVAAVFFIPNTPPEGEPADPTISEQDPLEAGLESPPVPV